MKLSCYRCSDWPCTCRDGITLVHGDCREVLPLLPPVDLVLTDPPYGIGRDGKRLSTSSHGGCKPYEFKGWDCETPKRAVFDLLFEKSKEQIIWGANYFPEYLSPSMGWLVWDKGQDICGSDCELAFTSFDRALRRKVINRVELAKDGAVHPTQKPLRLIVWCLQQSLTTGSVLDPFAGSGTTLVAAKQFGRKAIGIEIEEKYCEIAANRLRQEVFQFTD